MRQPYCQVSLEAGLTALDLLVCSPESFGGEVDDVLCAGQFSYGYDEHRTKLDIACHARQALVGYLEGGVLRVLNSETSN